MKTRTFVAVCAATALSLTLGACSSDSEEETTVTQTVTEQAPAEEASSEAEVEEATADTSEEVEAPAEDLVIPSGLEGMNGQLAYEQLKDAGFTGVSPTSVDPSRAMPIMYNNWTVTSVEPAAGTTVPADSTIILNMTKE